MNYNHTSETSETYDPDSKVVRSTQTVEQNSNDTNGGARRRAGFGRQRAAGRGAAGAAADGSKSNASGRTEETTNYEISKTIKTSTVDGGDVKRLSVAVVVDGTATAWRRLQAAHAARK